MAKNTKKIYVLEICYDDTKGEIEYIEEFVTNASSKPGIIPWPETVEVDEEYWELDPNTIGES